MFSERALRELFRTPGLFVLAQREPLGLAHPFLGNFVPIEEGDGVRGGEGEGVSLKL